MMKAPFFIIDNSFLLQEQSTSVRVLMPACSPLHAVLQSPPYSLAVCHVKHTQLAVDPVL